MPVFVSPHRDWYSGSQISIRHSLKKKLKLLIVADVFILSAQVAIWQIYITIFIGISPLWRICPYYCYLCICPLQLPKVAHPWKPTNQGAWHSKKYCVQVDTRASAWNCSFLKQITISKSRQLYLFPNSI